LEGAEGKEDRTDRTDRTDDMKTNVVERKYAEFRASLGELRVAEVESGALGRGKEEELPRVETERRVGRQGQGKYLSIQRRMKRMR